MINQTVNAVAVERKSQAPVDELMARAIECVKDVKAKAKVWYYGVSPFYSRIMEEKVTRKVVIRVHMITLCLFVAVAAAEANLMVAGSSMAATGWLVYRLNQDDKKMGGVNSNDKEGGLS